jgi:squalene-hopene/tetraprenyl-beta-curcumene cyclase
VLARHDDNFDSAIDWLLDAQHRQSDLAASVPLGGWGWTNTPGAVANVDDTAAVLQALAQAPRRERIERAALASIDWLLASQDDDGGWPMYGSGPSFVSSDRIGADSTAHALQALAAWKRRWQEAAPNRALAREQSSLDEQIAAAIERGLAYLATQQREDGSFLPLGFGNEHQADEANPVVGTAQVLAMCAELGELDSPLASRAGNWLLTAQHAVGSWGPPRVPLDYSGSYPTGTRTWRENDVLAQCSTVEETAQAVAALLPLALANNVYANAVCKGLTWLADAIEQDRHRRPAVLGWCFTRLWYHERLHPLMFAAGALSRAAGLLAPERPAVAAVGEVTSGV